MEVEMQRSRFADECAVAIGACGVAMLVVLTAAVAQGQTVDKRTYFTFSGPIEMPGVALPAGKYMFHIADPETGRTVVQVTSADGKRAYGMFFSLSAERLTAAPDAEVRFMEASAGAPPAIKTWWYPGERTGRGGPLRDPRRMFEHPAQQLDERGSVHAVERADGDSHGAALR